ncbi:MAG: hypothetical protein CME62_02730 [Halobacteriovoraceae bacterium]|nr:hypothetical protein [Halobacteriovoraceae bacterium]
MKCYKYLLIFILVMTHMTWAADEASLGTISKTSQEQVKNGDLVQLELETTLSPAELEPYKHTFIQKQIYLLDFKKMTSQLYSIEVFLADPVPPAPNAEEKPFKFKLNEFAIETDKNRMAQEFTLMKKDYVPPKSYLFWYIIAFAVVLIILLFYLKTRPDRIFKKKLKERRVRITSELLTLIKTAKTREELEEIYKRRKEIKNYLDLGVSLKRYNKTLNEIQYKPQWDETDLSQVLKAKEKLMNSQVSDGI